MAAEDRGEDLETMSKLLVRTDAAMWLDTFTRCLQAGLSLGFLHSSDVEHVLELCTRRLTSLGLTRAVPDENGQEEAGPQRAEGKVLSLKKKES